MMPRGFRWAIVWCSLILLATGGLAADDKLPTLKLVRISSSLDKELQPVRHWAPPRAASEPTPLLVSLHSWSADFRQDRSEWLQQAVERNWIYVQPNFRGVNDHPEACGSPLARQDILDAVDWACREYKVDSSCIYLAGVSGGGHMTLLMAAYHPDRFSAASAWCPPADLAEWYRFHSSTGTPARYAQMVAACCGGAPGQTPEIDAEYQSRSPVHQLQRVGDLPLDIATGIHDGKTGSVPIQHTLRAFNSVAKGQNKPTISDADMEELWTAGKLSQPQESDGVTDATYGRAIHLRRTAGNARVTIFEGTHEGLPSAACEWLSAQKRGTRPAREP